MAAFIVEHVPYDPDTLEISNFEAVCQSLGNHGVVAADLLYVGVEGKPFLHGDEPSDRRLTWGSAYADILAGYQAKAKGEHWLRSGVFEYAVHDPKRIVPAIAAYDINHLILERLVPGSNPPSWGQRWAHKDGGSVSEALRALVYLEYLGLYRLDSDN